LGASRQMGEI